MGVKLDAFDALRGYLTEIHNWHRFDGTTLERNLIQRLTREATYLVNLIEKDTQQRERYDEEIIQPELELSMRRDELLSHIGNCLLNDTLIFGDRKQAEWQGHDLFSAIMTLIPIPVRSDA